MDSISPSILHVSSRPKAASAAACASSRPTSSGAAGKSRWRARAETSRRRAPSWAHDTSSGRRAAGTGPCDVARDRCASGASSGSGADARPPPLLEGRSRRAARAARPACRRCSSRTAGRSTRSRPDAAGGYRLGELGSRWAHASLCVSETERQPWRGRWNQSELATSSPTAWTCASFSRVGSGPRRRAPAA